MTADDAAALNSAGLRALGAGDLAQAIALLARATAADPAAAQLWFNLATAHGAAGDTAAEGAALDAALDRDGFLVPALFGKARWLEEQGQTIPALDHYKRFLAAIDPAVTPGAGLATGIAHARACVTAANATIAAAIDTAMAAPLAKAPDNAAARFNRAVDIAFGRRRLYVQQPLVLHYPELPAEQFLSRHHFPWLAELEAATPAIRRELEALLAAGGDGFAPYVAYPPGAPVAQWHELNHNDSWAAQFLIQHGIPLATMAARCPETTAILARLPLFDLPGRGPVAFFSLLKPQTRIPPHTGATNIRTIVHLPLIVPDGCGFRVGNETREWREGEAFAFDDTIEHEAWNNSDELRAVLIIDAWNPHLNPAEHDLLRHYIAALDISGRGLESFDPG